MWLCHFIKNILESKWTWYSQLSRPISQRRVKNQLLLLPSCVHVAFKPHSSRFAALFIKFHGRTLVTYFMISLCFLHWPLLSSFVKASFFLGNFKHRGYFLWIICRFVDICFCPSSAWRKYWTKWNKNCRIKINECRRYWR